MTPAEELRAAAARMRELAAETSAGQWYVADRRPGHIWSATASVIPEHVARLTSDQAEEQTQANAAHMAAWHPAVALAVADWLEQEAASVVIAGDTAAMWEKAPALAVARAFMGEEQA